LGDPQAGLLVGEGRGGCSRLVERGPTGGRDAAAEIELPPTDVGQPIRFTADESRHWQEGKQEVWILKGNCRITQGTAVATARDAVIWIDHAEPFRLVPHKVTVYLEHDVKVQTPPSGFAQSRPDLLFEGDQWLGRFFTSDRIVPFDDHRHEFADYAHFRDRRHFFRLRYGWVVLQTTRTT
jgi:hypothetical protein